MKKDEELVYQSCVLLCKTTHRLVFAVVVHNLVDWYFVGNGFGDLHGNMLFNWHWVGLFHMVCYFFFHLVWHGFLDGDGDGFNDGYCHRLRYVNVNGVRLRYWHSYWFGHWDGNGMRHWNGFVLVNWNRNVFRHFHCMRQFVMTTVAPFETGPNHCHYT